MEADVDPQVPIPAKWLLALSFDVSNGQTPDGTPAIANEYELELGVPENEIAPPHGAVIPFAGSNGAILLVLTVLA